MRTGRLLHKPVLGPLKQVVHLWAYENLADYEARSARRDQDPDWAAYLRASGHLIMAQEDRLLRAAALPSLALGRNNT
jgi:hypothetical protein